MSHGLDRPSGGLFPARTNSGRSLRPGQSVPPITDDRSRPPTIRRAGRIAGGRYRSHVRLTLTGALETRDLPRPDRRTSATESEGGTVTRDGAEKSDAETDARGSQPPPAAAPTDAKAAVASESAHRRSQPIAVDAGRFPEPGVDAGRSTAAPAGMGSGHRSCGLHSPIATATSSAAAGLTRRTRLALAAVRGVSDKLRPRPSSHTTKPGVRWVRTPGLCEVLGEVEHGCAGCD